MKKLLLALCIPILSYGSAAKENKEKVYTEHIYSYASMESLQAKVNKFLKENPDVVLKSITWSSIKRTGIEQNEATVMYVTKNPYRK